VTKATKSTKATDTIRISTENIRRLYSLAGKLQEKIGDKQTLDDAINYLFENQKEEKKRNEG
jgi:hypothetical protein